MELEEYLDVCKKAWEIMKEKEKEYGDSWKKSNLTFLETRFYGELREVLKENNIPKKGKECLDVINMAVMFFKRLEMCGTDSFAEIQAIEKDRAREDALYWRFGTSAFPPGR